MSMNADVIRQIAPNAIPLGDFYFNDEGQGQVLAHWNEAKLGPRPTQAQLEQAEAEAIAALENKRQDIAVVRQQVIDLKAKLFADFTAADARLAAFLFVKLLPLPVVPDAVTKSTPKRIKTIKAAAKKRKKK